MASCQALTSVRGMAGRLDQNRALPVAAKLEERSPKLEKRRRKLTAKADNQGSI